MEHFLHEVLGSMPDGTQAARLTLRLLVALIVGAIIGLQREMRHKTAGLRTHMLVSLGTALLIVSVQAAQMQSDAVSRVIQGIVTGIGFLGAGAILKLTEERRVHGLTTSAGIWMTAAGGIAAGLGQFVPALIGALLAWFVLSVLWRLERRKRWDRKHRHHSEDPSNVDEP
jgi:putative Mg2+ transporter-C (MgtC) family protein